MRSQAKPVPRPKRGGPFIPFSRITTVPRETVRTLATALITKCIADNKNVSLPDIVKQLEQKQGQSITEMGYRIYDIPELVTLRDKENEVISYIQTFISLRSISTLWEMERGICEAVLVEDFRQLGLGPILKHPLVLNFFVPPPTLVAVPEITTMEVVKALHLYRRKIHFSKIEVPDFMKYFGERKSVASPNHLCVRITGLGLYITMMARVDKAEVALVQKQTVELQAEARKIVDDGREEQLQKLVEIEEEKEKELKRIAEEIGKEVTGAWVKLMMRCKKYTEFPHIVHAIKSTSFHNREQLLEIVVQLLQLIHSTDPSVFSEEAQHAFTELKKLCPADEDLDQAALATHILGGLCTRRCRDKANRIRVISEATAHVLLYCRASQLALAVTDSATMIDNKDKENYKQSVEEPRLLSLEIDEDVLQTTVIRKLDMLADKKESLTPINILLELEAGICEQFKVEDFSELGHGSLVAFLSQCGPNASDILNKMSTSHAGAAIPFEQVSDFVRQCRDLCKHKLGATTNGHFADALESAICAHFGVLHASELGFGDATNIIQKIQSEATPIVTSITSMHALTCEVALLKEHNTISNTEDAARDDDAKSKGSLLGIVTEKDAFAAFQQCPYLVDIGKWTEWQLFYSSLGSLSNFIVKNQEVLNQQSPPIHLFQETAGTYYKLCPPSNPNQFLESALASDPYMMSVRLVSIIDAHNGISQSPLALMSSYMKTAIKALEAELAVKFILDCFVLIPFPILQHVAWKIFLEPLTKHVPHALQALLSCASTLADFSQERKRVLHKLGLVLGIPKWIEDYKADSIDQNIHDTPPKRQPTATSNLNSSKASSIPPPRFPIQNLPTSSPTKIENSSIVKDTCKHIIDSIRENEFGIGKSFAGEVSELIDKQHERIGRALKRLSHELYSHDTHFVLELVQNADDNMYDGVLPTLQFCISNIGITVQNNETGFAEKNVRALCDVGNSTKENASGYIGKKGIGFKSVFRISDAPQIHSNGYHFKFDAASGSMGYILPHWINDGELPPNVHDWGTTIVLPFKDSMKNESAVFISKFSDIHPSLLLFLRNIRCINIIDDIQNIQRSFIRRDVSEYVVEVFNDEEVTQWMLVKKKVPPKVLRENVQFTEISLAFPLQSPDSDPNTLPDHQQVFAFLPLRNYGFRFVIQADFIVPSSREDVDRDSPWNDWLRSEIPNLFIETFEILKNSSAPLMAIGRMFQFVPLEGDIVGFFHPVARRIFSVQFLSSPPLLSSPIFSL